MNFYNDKRTKIVVSLGPSSLDDKVLEDLVKSGMNVARINASHGGHDVHLEKIVAAKKVREKMNVSIAILYDTKGPDVRCTTFGENDETVDLVKGQEFTFVCDDKLVGDSTKVGLKYTDAYKYVKAGDEIIAIDGLLRFEVKKVEGKNIVCVVTSGYTLKQNKAIYFPGIDLKIPFLTEADKEDLKFAIEQDVDMIAASFVNNKENLIELKNYLKKIGAKESLPIISKVESVEGFNKLEEILENSDGVMVARGDLGVEFPIYKLTSLQDTIMKKTLQAGKTLIVATEMLESMINKQLPTRAESLDVGNAVRSGASAVMLSAESAVGKYPVQTVKMMADICRHTEQNSNCIQSIDLEDKTASQYTASTIVSAAQHIGVTAIVVFSTTGNTALNVARLRPTQPIYAFCMTKPAYYKLSLSYNVTPIFEEHHLDTGEKIAFANKYVLENGIAKKGDYIVINSSYKETKTMMAIIHQVV